MARMVRTDTMGGPSDAAAMLGGGTRQHVSSGREGETQMVIDQDPRADVEVSERPWGRFEQLAHNRPVTVKVITVAPNARLSLQYHHHRAEMWQILDGPLQVRVGDEEWHAAPGDLVWIPAGAVHRVGNTGTEPGRVLEIAYGDFDEEDIVRLEDDYGREN